MGRGLVYISNVNKGRALVNVGLSKIDLVLAVRDWAWLVLSDDSSVKNFIYR
jgi:hypothetical protein